LAKNIGKKYALQWLAAMTQVIESDYLIQIATVVITPLYNLVELPDASETKGTSLFSNSHGFPVSTNSNNPLDLKSTSLEILSMLQTKIGTTEYVKAYTTVRQFVQERRMERKQKRAIELVAEPEVAAKRKSRKNERKKTVRKEKVSKHREYRRGKVL
jgi:U3 small nucleolar RNA-associated protein 20